jgi:hypothetical protein
LHRASIAILVSLVATAPVIAALPPQYQRQAELQAIIDSMEVVDAFGFDGIGSIEYAGDDVYVVTGGSCRLEVTIVDVPNTHGEGWAGPREFTIEVGETVCE